MYQIIISHIVHVSLFGPIEIQYFANSQCVDYELISLIHESFIIFVALAINWRGGVIDFLVDFIDCNKFFYSKFNKSGPPLIDTYFVISLISHSVWQSRSIFVSCYE